MKPSPQDQTDNRQSPIANRQSTAASAVMYFRQQEGHLDPEQLRAEFAKLGRNDPLWSALMQLVQTRLANAVVAAAGRDLNAPGRIEELLDLQRELAGLRDLKTERRRDRETER